MRAITAFILALAAGFPALAAQPEPGKIGFQPAATPVMREIATFHDLWLMPLITVISALVLALLVWVMIRYNARSNPTPQKFSHNTLVEIVWTGVPVLILVVIAIPSFKLLYHQDVVPDGKKIFSQAEGVIPAPEVTIKAIGHQWFWEYEYPDNEGLSFYANLLPEDQATKETWLLATDQPLVAPAGTTVRLLVTATDVIHAWAMPAFGIKIDAIPGRLNEQWFKVDQPGVYYGQCSELCGDNHAYMPIQVEIVAKDTYAQWVAAKSSGDDEGAARILAEYKSELAGETRLAAR